MSYCTVRSYTSFFITTQQTILFKSQTSRDCIVIILYIHTRSLQYARITFCPPVTSVILRSP